jgi:hypothetical protein
MPTKATVTGRDEAIGSEVPRLLGAKGAEPDPEGESAEEEDALLGEERDEKSAANLRVVPGQCLSGGAEVVERVVCITVRIEGVERVAVVIVKR